VIPKEGPNSPLAPKSNGWQYLAILLFDGDTVHNAFFDVRAMKIKYFQDTETLHIEFRACEVAETKDLDENTILDLDYNGQICAITIEHAEIPKFSYEQITP
jgi:uncharacterized protein YuzE